MADVITGELTGKSIEGALAIAGVSADNREDFGKALSAVGTAAKIWKTVVYYKHAAVRIIASNTSVHKPLEGQSKFAVFIARAGVSPDEWEEYQKLFGPDAINKPAQTAYRAVRDCLSTHGLPVLADLGDIAKDAENWYVEWEIAPKDSPHVEIKLGGSHPADDENVFEFPGQLQNKLERASPTSAETDLRLTIKPEPAGNHPGLEIHEPVQVCASVQAGGSPPSLGTLANAAKGGLGLIDSLVEISAGWMQTMLTPRGCATLDISFHTPYRIKIEGKVNYQYSESGGSESKDEQMDAQFSAILGQGDPKAWNSLNTVFRTPVTLSSSYHDTGRSCDSGVISGESKWHAAGDVQDGVLGLSLGVDNAINNSDPTDFAPIDLPWLCSDSILPSGPPLVSVFLYLPLDGGPVNVESDGRNVVGLENALGLDLGAPRTYRFTVTPGVFGPCELLNSVICVSVASWELTITLLRPDSS